MRFGNGYKPPLTCNAMVAIAKTILIAILAGVAFIIVLQVGFFFPFYMSMIVETFNMANIAANDNYIKVGYYKDALDNLHHRPMFNKFNSGDPHLAIIEAIHEDDGKSAIEPSPGHPETYYNAVDGPTVSGVLKPYRQRGSAITITVKAWYPLRMTLWGRNVAPVDIPVTFSMTTTTLKYYKDLDLI